MRQATIDTLRDMAAQCDGVRCDMAMLMMNDIFQRTWGWRMAQLGIERPAEEFWPEVQQQGFDYTYDKRLYDRLRDEQPDALKVHLRAEVGFQAASVRFIENHDEPRAIETYKPTEKHKMAAIVTMTTPGAVLLHDGQFTGRRIKLPVQIGREMDEPVDEDLKRFYADLLREAHHPCYDGAWRLLDTSVGGLLAYAWLTPSTARLVIANLTGAAQEGNVYLPAELGSRMLVNVMSGQTALHAGTTLHVRFAPYQASIYQ
nr:alpha-amylase [Anaerolineae bacterium]